jgi:glutamate-1-semialdehyde 2,1-aminomutase
MLMEAGSGMSSQRSSPGIPAAVEDSTLIAELDDTDALEEIFAGHGRDIAAAIIEPLPANYGLLPQRDDFLHTLHKLCQQNSTLLIFDEVITGFRVEFGGYSARSGIVPDLFTWGKIIGAGFPVGAYAGRADLMQQVAPAGAVYQAGTLSANPLAMRCGLAALEQLDDGSVYTQLETLGAQLEKGINKVDGLGIQRVGSIFWLRNEDTSVARSVSNFDSARLENFSSLFNFLLERGIYLAPSPYEVGFLSTAHTEDDIHTLISACGEFVSGC